MKIRQHIHLIIPLLLGLLGVAGLGVCLIARTPAPAPTTEPATEPTTAVARSERVELTPEASEPRPTPKPTRRGWRIQLPLVARPAPSPTPTSPPSPTPRQPTPTPTPTPKPVDFDAARADLRAQGKDLAFVKIGFHVGPGGNPRGLGVYLDALAASGVPAVLKSVDEYGVCVQALNDNPDNIVIFRMTGGDLELPDYTLPPETSAEQHWARILDALPSDFDRRIWLEVMNEPDKVRADWLGRFALRTAQLALRDGYRFAAFGWSSGEPEPYQWETPGMLAFLNLASQHPERIAVALHEYSYTVKEIGNKYPELVGRFQALFRICDQRNIPRPTVLITEWGWEAGDVPDPDNAMDDITWASRLYAAYPEVKGAAIWYLGGGYDIAEQAQRLIDPLRWHALGNYFVIEPNQKPTNPGLFRSGVLPKWGAPLEGKAWDATAANTP